MTALPRCLLQRRIEMDNDNYFEPDWWTEIVEYMYVKYDIDIDEVICDEILKAIMDENQKDEVN